MVFLIVHNLYSKPGGEESVVRLQKNLLESKGHKVIVYTRDYNEKRKTFLNAISATFSSVYSSSSVKAIEKIISENKIDVALIHNVFSLVSPAILPLLKKNKIKVFQIVHNYRLFCPIGIFFSNDHICEACLHRGREWNCVKNNCTKSFFSNVSFALKFYLVRKLDYYKNVDRFLTLSEFQSRKLSENKIPQEKIVCLPNTYIPLKDSVVEQDDEKKQFVGFVGRLTKEKGFFDFVETARKIPNRNFIVAGEVPKTLSTANLPKNLSFEGFLDAKGLERFYNKCRLILFPSSWYEGFPMVLLEAMYYRTPIIVYNLSVMAEVVKDNLTGFVLPLHDLETMVQKTELLFKDKALYCKLRENNKEIFENVYSADHYYKRLIEQTKKQIETK